jgi:hypothetical protein
VLKEIAGHTHIQLICKQRERERERKRERVKERKREREREDAQITSARAIQHSCIYWIYIHVRAVIL